MLKIKSLSEQSYEGNKFLLVKFEQGEYAKIHRFGADYLITVSDALEKSEKLKQLARLYISNINISELSNQFIGEKFKISALGLI